MAHGNEGMNKVRQGGAMGERPGGEEAEENRESKRQRRLEGGWPFT